MVTKACGCEYGACFCGSADKRTDAQIREGKFKEKIDSISWHFNAINSQLGLLEREVGELRSEKKNFYGGMISRAEKEGLRIIELASKDAEKIVKVAAKQAKLYEKFPKILKKAKIIKKDIARIIALMSEIDHSETVEVLTDLLENGV